MVKYCARCKPATLLATNEPGAVVPLGAYNHRVESNAAKTDKDDVLVAEGMSDYSAESAAVVSGHEDCYSAVNNCGCKMAVDASKYADEMGGTENAAAAAIEFPGQRGPSGGSAVEAVELVRC